MKDDWLGIGVMSGTSLDGIDLAWCNFKREGQKWLYSIEKAVTVPYSDVMRGRLANAMQMSASDYVKLSNDIAVLIADNINRLISEDSQFESAMHPDFIASHGHTVFHQPEIGLTTQIGNGAVIAARTGIPVVCDFRSKDVALGGQGAPLVPIGDELLFSNYDACLNLGGFSNISFQSKNQRIAFDVSPCNMALNYLANLKNMPFDKGGNIAKKGTIIGNLLESLNKLPFYHIHPPKSLGKEWFDKTFLPVLEDYSNASVEDRMRTVVEHISMQITKAVPEHCKSMLITGGGAMNAFLVERVRKQNTQTEITVPDGLVIEYKEALIFAFLGLLRLNGECNTLKSVTGARVDSCGGCVYL